MRRQLILVFLAVSTLVATAFVVPLGFLVRRTAQDRAIDAARADTAAVIPALAAGGSRFQIEAAMAATEAGSDARMTVHTSQGWEIGATVTASAGIDAALASGASSITSIGGGVEVVAAVASGPDELSAIRVYVPDARLRQGQWRAWSVLAGVGVALIALSVFVADRLSRNIVQPTRRLALAARQLGAGDLSAKVDPDGPDELVELAGAFNTLGARVSSMLDRERELVAELSHRLRTPLTKLRMRIEQVEDPEMSERLSADLDDLTSEVNVLILEARKVTSEPGGCDLTEVATARAEFWQVLAEDQLRPWSFRACDGPLPVAVDPRDLGAAIDVLIENVFAHTPEAAPLSIECRSADDFGELVVGDGGPGFGESQFERGRSSSGSTGLGLDIAARLAADAGGQLSIDTGPLGGAQVTLALPLDPKPSR